MDGGRGWWWRSLNTRKDIILGRGNKNNTYTTTIGWYRGRAGGRRELWEENRGKNMSEEEEDNKKTESNQSTARNRVPIIHVYDGLYVK